MRLLVLFMQIEEEDEVKGEQSSKPMNIQFDKSKTLTGPIEGGKTVKLRKWR